VKVELIRVVVKHGTGFEEVVSGGDTELKNEAIFGVVGRFRPGYHVEKINEMHDPEDGGIVRYGCCLGGTSAWGPVCALLVAR